MLAPSHIVSTSQGHVALGDCLDLLTMCEPGSADMVLADLPYGVTQDSRDVPIDLTKLWPLLIRVAKANTAYVFTCQMPYLVELFLSQSAWYRYDIVWDKVLSTGFLNAKKQPLRTHETVLVFYAEQPVYNPQMTDGEPNHAWKKRNHDGGENYGASTRAEYVASDKKHPTSVLHFKKPHPTVARHRTEKSVELFEWLIKTYTNEGAVVLDPTCGSGTTAEACVKSGRRFIVMDKDPECFDTTKTRLAELAA